MEQQSTQLLCTFTTKASLSKTIIMIQDMYTIFNDKIFVLENVALPSQLLLTYNVNPEDWDPTEELRYKTISIHRKKDSNTLYTINALNFLVALLNDGTESKTFQVPWENYRNCLLVLNENQLKKISTKLNSIQSL
ncbi:MAG: hypothetical protein WC346_11385 [Methanogenium sp.]|jgi:hypothetical protein